MLDHSFLLQKVLQIGKTMATSLMREKWFTFCVGTCRQSQNPSLWEITDRGAEGVTSLSEVWKQYEEEQIDMFIML